MKLYAVREKETGKLVIEDPKREEWALSKRFGDLWVEDNPEEMESFAKEVSADLNTTLEVVTLRIEPTEPCEFCRDFVIFLTPKRQDVPVVEEGKPAKICPWCGRSLT